MSSKIYVGNLSWSTDDETLRQAFSRFGPIVDSIVMRDRETQRSRGFGFVTYGTEKEAEDAILGMNDQDLDGRKIRVNIANARGGGGSGGGGGGGYSGQGYSGGGAVGGYQTGYQGGSQGQGGYNAQPGFAGYPQQGYQQGGYQQGGYPQGGYQQGGYQQGGYPSGGY